MTINDYISLLDDIRDNAEKLSDLTGMTVDIDMMPGACAFQLAIYDHANGDRFYFKDFYHNDLDSMGKHIESMIIGAKLAKGIEI